MFKVSKSPRPTDWTTKDYKDPTVISQLKKDFHAKCYICEQKHFPNLNVEHFIPHLDDESLKLDWNNLYYACSRCNSIKNKYYDDMLDCCNQDHLVEEWIKVYYRMPDEDIEVINACPNDHVYHAKTETTKELISKCFNNANSGIQEVSKEDLREKIFEVHNDFLALRREFFRELDNWQEAEKIKKADDIKHRLKSHYAFSAILRGYLEKDSKWRTALEEIEQLKLKQSA
ncbi:TPA: HNH endonuclease [Acinetobacter baumannii]|uniref:HNH endonuclease n=1 Tax=Acinetobacter baumannii TaxID=470 RepID=UPI0026EA7425|nr:HNH endonuclease [Acinetobacter baumannii]HEE5794699.1 HNH endonuclease [Acinetobacter baumannii]